MNGAKARELPEAKETRKESSNLLPRSAAVSCGETGNFSDLSYKSVEIVKETIM